MKKYLLLLILALCLMACGSESKSGDSLYTNLEVGDSSSISAKRITGTIATNQEVDLYQVDLTETGRNVQIKCTQKSSDEDISGDQQTLTLLMQIYEEVDGELVMVAGEHAPINSPLPADLKQTLYVDRAKSVFVHVRELMDDYSSDRPYYISATYEEPSDGNDSLNGTDTIILSIDGDSQTDSIGSIGDADYFKFTTTAAGVYNASVDYTSYLSAGVELNISLIESDGTIIENRPLATTGTANLIHNLEAGDYAVVVTEQGNNDFSPTSFFEVSISSVSGIEVNENDSPDPAATPIVSANGSIDYYEDQDWYKLTHAGAGDFSVLNLSFSSLETMGFQIYLYAINDIEDFTYGVTESVFENIYMRQVHGELNATIKLDRANAYYVMVKAADGSDVNEGKDYSLTMEMSSINDADDATPEGNNAIGNATPLPTQNDDHSGKIAFRGDIDYYSITIPTGDDQILSVYLDVPEDSNVDYGLQIQNELGTPIKTVQTPSASRRGMDLETAIQVESDQVLRVKVYDLQSNNSDTDTYTINWNVAVAAPPGNKGGEPTTYHSEADEAILTDSVILRYIVDNDYETRTFNVNSTVMNMDDVPNDDSIASGHTFDWVAGYIDYQGDEDWFSLDLTNAVGITPLPEKYYYTISLELYSGIDGSPVEYTLELLPDVDGNQRVNSHTGIQAALGDQDPADNTSIDLSLTSADTTLRHGSPQPTCVWVGTGDTNQWRGPVYFRIRDFYNIRLANGSVYPFLDKDWSVAVPYYFRVTVKLVSGHNHPYTDFATYND